MGSRHTTNKELMTVVNKEYHEIVRRSAADKFRHRGASVLWAKRRQEKAVDDMMKDWMNGGHGIISEEKQDGIFRIIWENWNSLKLFTEKDNDRVARIEAIRKKYNADVVAGCETQVN